MRRFYFIALLLLVNSSTFLQTAVGEKSDSLHIVMPEVALRVNKLEISLKKNDAALLTPYLAPDFSLCNEPPAVSREQVLPRLLKQWPKGRFLINNFRTSASGGYDGTLIMPGMLYLDVTMDSAYRFRSINEATHPDSFYDIATSFHADHLSFPFETIGEYYYPMIKGSVNGKSGYFMFDTGNPMGFLLNNHFLNLTKIEKIADGKMASGQQMGLFYQDTLASIKVGSEVTLHNLRNIVHADFEYIEKGIVPEFLGFIGYDAFKQYGIKIDYQKKKIDLYRLNDQGEPILSYAQPTPAIGILKFQTSSNEPQIPKILFTVNGKSLPTILDTGYSSTILVLTEGTQDNLKKRGLLKMIKSPRTENSSEHWQLIGLVHEGQKFNIPSATLETGDSDKAELGGNFLNQFITSWNYRTKVIALYPIKK